MEIRNYLAMTPLVKSIHEGNGLARSRKVFGAEDFESGLRYVSFTELDPGSSIGEHGHPDTREEIYVIQSGNGRMRIDGEERAVIAGDVILTRAGSTHALFNDSDKTLAVFIFYAV